MIKAAHYLSINAETIVASQFKFRIKYGGWGPRITLKVSFSFSYYLLESMSLHVCCLLALKSLSDGIIDCVKFLWDDLTDSVVCIVE